jgi:hypothetical protein
MTDDTLPEDDTEYDDLDDEAEDEPAPMPSNVLGMLIFFGIIGVTATVMGGLVLALNDLTDTTGLVLLPTGLAALAVGIGLWRRSRLAHGLAYALGGWLALIGLARFLTGGFLLTGFGAYMVWALSTRPVKDWFGIR